MKRTFKERAVSKAAKVSKKYKILTPFVFVILAITLGGYSIVRYFSGNGKKYITIGMTLLFFLMSTSFATPDQAIDKEIYLQSNVGNVIIADNEVSLDSGVSLLSLSNASSIELNDADEIISANLISEEEEKELESTENIDVFTISDFYSGMTLSDEDKSNTSEISGFNKDAWYLLLVNKTHPVPDDYEVKLATIKGSMQCDERVLDPLFDMLSSADKSGISLIVCSPYRDYQLQEKLFLRKIDAYMSYGLSYLESYKAASQKVIMPGASEHQLGIAFDIVVSDHAVLDYEFGDTKGGRWLKENCAEYGFILRYPRGKEDITGIEYEPWHFRYVGVDAAKYIMEHELTLEEFLDDL